MDLFAAEIGMDPAEVRRRNLIPPDAFPFTHQGRGDLRQRRLRQGASTGCSRPRATRSCAPSRPRAASAATPSSSASASSAFVEITGGGAFAEDATVEVHPDGTVTVLTGTSPHGQGHATAWAMLASEQLGIPVEMITVRHGDTDLVPRGAGTMGSRSLQPGGVAVHQAAVELVELAKQRAADVLEADGRRPRGGRAARCGCAARTPSVALGRARRVRAAADGGARFDSGAAHVPVRRAPRRRRGRRRDRQGGRRPDRHRRRRRAGAQPAARRGPAARRHRPGHRPGAVRGGRATTTTATRSPPASPTTRFPSAAELPSFDARRHGDARRTSTRWGSKGIGEAGTIGATPAVQNAVIDAVAHLGVRHIDMPATPLRVWEAIQAARTSGGSA